MHSNVILASSCAGSLQPLAPYEVISHDRYATPGEEPPLHHGSFTTEASAIACARAVVDRGFADALRQRCATRADFVDWFASCGEFPSIYHARPVAWQAMDYAAQIAASGGQNVIELHAQGERQSRSGISS
jgi:hypothetical protein